MKLQKVGSEYAITINTWSPEEMAKVDAESIPGLRVDARRNCIIGPPDAVAVAAKRLNVQQRPPMFDGLPAEALKMPKELRDYQRKGVTRIYNTLKSAGGALLCDDMGLGKTVQSITVMQHLPGRKLVICPASVRETWRDSLQRWGIKSYAILSPTKNKAAMQEWAEAKTKEWVVCSYGQVEKAIEFAFPERAVPCLIIDEVHLCKGRRNVKRSKAVEMAAVYSQYRLGLTGTPIWNRPNDLWKILKILLGSRFGSSWAFDHAYCRAFIDDHGGLNNKGISNPEELKLRLDYYMVRRLKRDVSAELPPLTRQTLWIDAQPAATQAFQKAVLLREPGGWQKALEATLRGKLETAMELAAELGRFVIFTHHREHATQMAKVLAEKYDAPAVAIHGGMDTIKRQQQIKLAIAKGWGVVATIDSVGTGVDILKDVASTAIVHYIDYVPRKMAQMEARLDRIGQKEPVNIIYLAMKESADQVVIKTVLDKLDQERKLLGTGTDMRNALGDYVDGAGAETAEKEALAALYADMENE